jgi:uncharacterized paraquat-inducible protein A
MPKPRKSRPAPTVSCTQCKAAWYGRSMAEGLRLLAACPRCGAELMFTSIPSSAVASDHSVDEVPPHLVLGIPRAR